MAPPTTSELANNLVDAVQQLHQDIEQTETREPVMKDLREVRRLLNGLEMEVRSTGSDAIGDAC